MEVKKIELLRACNSGRRFRWRTFPGLREADGVRARGRRRRRISRRSGFESEPKQVLGCLSYLPEDTDHRDLSVHI